VALGCDVLNQNGETVCTGSETFIVSKAAR
jgi:hypothetical protein